MPHWNVLLISMISMVFYSLANAAVPYLMETIINALGSLNELNSYFVPVLLLVIFTIRGFTDVVTVYGLGWLGRRVIRDLRSEIFNKYLALPTSYYEATSSGSMISKLTYNTEQVAQAISDISPRLSYHCCAGYSYDLLQPILDTYCVSSGSLYCNFNQSHE